METASAKALIDILIENASRILRAGYGVNSAEHEFFAILDLVKSQEALRKHFIDLVARTLAQLECGDLSEGMVPRELIELAAHETRWPEFMSLAKKRVEEVFVGQQELAIGDVARSIFEAMDPCWPDREFYSRYRRKA